MILARSICRWVSMPAPSETGWAILFTYLGSPHKLPSERLGTLLQGIENQSEWTGRVSQVEQPLKEQQTMRPLVRLSRGRHRMRFGIRRLKV